MAEAASPAVPPIPAGQDALREAPLSVARRGGGTPPAFAELPLHPAAPAASSWGVWGDADRCGTLNLLTAERVRRAIGLVAHGDVFPLDLPLDAIDPPLFGRARLRRAVEPLGPAGAAFDETLLGWNLQATTQWDGFAHVEEPGVGSYNGIARRRHGVDAWATHGVVGRGVLADLEPWWRSEGRAPDPTRRAEIGAAELAAVLEHQRVAVEPGDVLLVRTGWLARYGELDLGGRVQLAGGTGGSTGLAADEAMVALLWDWHIAAVAADNPSLEAWPPAGPGRSLHRSLLARLGIPIGELFALDELARRCAELDRYEFFFVSVPLNLPGGVASPANAVAIL